MNSFKYSALSHRDLVYANPISEIKMETLIELLQLTETDEVLDVGAGSAELPIRLIERYGVKAVGVEHSPFFLQIAREEATERLSPDRLALYEEIEGGQFQPNRESFDLAICIGATIIFGDYAGTLDALPQYVKKGGYVLVGELFWKKEPEEAYLTEFGVKRNEYSTHAANIDLAIAKGLTPIYSMTANEDEWDTYEWSRIRSIEQYATEQPDDPDVPNLLSLIRSWRDLYVRWGRDTLGFGLYLFQK